MKLWWALPPLLLSLLVLVGHPAFLMSLVPYQGAVEASQDYSEILRGGELPVQQSSKGERSSVSPPYSSGSAALDLPLAFSFVQGNFSLDDITPASVTIIGDTITLTGNNNFAVGTAFYSQRLYTMGFEVDFEFVVTGSANNNGLTFIMQGDNAHTYGGAGGGLGYSDENGTPNVGMTNSLVVEFDLHQDTPLNDPNGHHVSLHSRGAQPNSAVEGSPATSWCPHGLYTNLAVANGVPTPASVSYTPPLAPFGVFPPLRNGTLTVHVANLPDPVVSCSVDLLALMGESGRRLFMGFGAATGPTASPGDSQQVTSWSYSFLGVPTVNNTKTRGRALSEVVGGEVSSFFLMAYDQFGFPYDFREVSFTGHVYDLSQGRHVPVTVSYLSNNTYTAQYTLYLQGTYNLWAFLDGNLIPGFPNPITVVAGPVYPPYTTVSGPTPNVAAQVAGTVFTFTLGTHDEYNNTVTVGGQLFNVTLGSCLQCKSSITVTDNKDGSYLVTCNVTTATEGSTLFFGVGGTPFFSTSLTVVAGPVSNLGSLVVTNDIASGLVAGTTGLVTLLTRDLWGNPIESGGANVTGYFVQSLSGGGIVSAEGGALRVADEGTGLYVASITETLVGNYSLALFVSPGGSPAERSPLAGTPLPFLVVTTGIAVASQCSGSGPGLAPRQTVGSNSFTIVPRDAYGNPIHHDKGLPVSAYVVSVADAKVNVSAGVTFSGDSYFVTYDVTTAGLYKVYGALGGALIGGAPWPVQLEPGLLTPLKCYLVGGSLAFASQRHPSTFYVATADLYGNLLTTGGANITAEFTHTKTGNVTKGSVQDLHNGTYAVNFVLYEAGSFSVAVAANGSPIGGSPFSLFVAWGHTAQLIIAITGGVGVLAAASFFFLYWKKSSKRNDGFVRL